MFQCVKRRTMANDQHGLTGKCGRKFRQPGGGTVDHLLVALAAGERRGDVKRTNAVNLTRWMSRQRSIVAFTEPGLTDNCNATIAERDLGGPKCTSEIRTEHGGDGVVTMAMAKLARLAFAARRQPGIEPAGGEP